MQAMISQRIPIPSREFGLALLEPFGIRQASDFPGTARNGSPRGGRENCVHPARQPMGKRLPRAPLRDELLNGGIFYLLREAKIIIGS